MSIDRYDPIRVLGEGSFGKVYLMRDKTKRNFVCVKIIKIKNIPKKEREATKLEVDLLKRLHHPNIVGYVDSFLSKNHESLCICMEYCDGGDLASQIKAAKRNLFSESKILHWFVQLALGLQYMHGNKVLHRDLKTQNVFLLGNGRLVLGDLGISKVLDGTMDFAQTCIGTPYYMSPEIFKNKPYSYKSDVWALGCVLYELTTLNHAFDANSLNGLATKIVKGKYPPINAKYSKYLRDLITQMLMLNPQQRPDLDQILRKPFIKKHIVNFFVDIAARPSASIGEGTMILKAAAGGGAAGGSIMNDQSMMSLRHQLQVLDMMDMVAEALRPKERPQDDQEAIRQAKEQASALKREQDHKRMVEAALEKLRQEREIRARQRGGPITGGPAAGGRAVAGVAAAAAPIPSARRDDPRGVDPRRPPVNPSPSNGAVPGNIAVPSNAGRGLGRDAKDASPAANQVRDKGFNWDRPRPAGAGGVGDGLPPPRYDDVSSGGSNNSNNNNGAAGGRRRTFEDREKAERDRKAAEDRRRQIQEQEAAAKIRSDERRREEAKAEARVREAREEARLREEARAREAAAEAERLKLEQAKEKVEQASRARRDAQREKERERQRMDIEQLKRDKLELDRRTQEREKMREDRRIQEASRLDAVRREQMDVMQEKLDFMNDQINRLDVNPRRNNNANNNYVPSMAEEKNSELSARERVYLRRQEKQAKEESDRLDALRAAENENRRIRQAAQSEYRSKIYADNAAVLPGAGNSGSGAPSHRRYISDPSPQAAPDEFDTPPVSRYEFDSAGRQQRRSSDNSSYGIQMAAAAAASHTNSDSGSEDELFGKPRGIGGRDGVAANAGANDEEEEDLVRREEELRAELNFATMRCEELRRTLQETKSFLGPRLPTRGKDVVSRGAALRPAVAPSNGAGIAAADEEVEEDDYLTEDEEEDYEEDFDEAPPQQQQRAVNNNYNNGRGAVATGAPPRKPGSFSVQTDFDDDRSAGSGNLGDRTLPRLRPPESAVPSSAYGALQDMPSPSGKLSDRIERLRQRCKEALGERVFWEAYNFLKQHEMESQGYDNGRDLNDDDFEARKMSRVRAILGERKEHYVSLIDQLIFMEDAEHD